MKKKQIFNRLKSSFGIRRPKPTRTSMSFSFLHNHKSILVGVGVAGILGLGGYLLTRRSRPSSPPTPNPTISTSFSTSVPCSPSVPDIEDLYGFNRKSKEPVKFEDFQYRYHMFVCSGTTDWPEKFSSVNSPLSELLDFCKKNFDSNLFNFTVSDDTTRGSPNSLDVLLFPQGERINVVNGKLEDFRERVTHLVNQQEKNIILNPIKRHHIYVCSHKARDARCGECGPKMAHLLSERIKERGIGEHLTVNQCSHVGGHKYAANCLVFPPGDWFGNLCPDHVDHLLDYVAQNHAFGFSPVPEVLKPFHRGRMKIDSIKKN